MTSLKGEAVLSCRRHFVVGREMGEFSSLSGLEDGTEEAMSGLPRRSDKKYYVKFYFTQVSP